MGKVKLTSLNMDHENEYENIFLNSEHDVILFIKKIEDANLIPEKPPFFVSEKDNNMSFHQDAHIRLYKRPGIGKGIRAIYPPRLEWSASKVQKND